MDEQCAQLAGRPMAMMGTARDGHLSVQRRRELIALAERACDWIMQNHILPDELCFFRQAVGMLVGD